MPIKKILPKLVLTCGFLALFTIIIYRAALKDKWRFNLERIKIYFDNFFYQGERHPPLSLLQKETELKLYVGEPFRDFDQEQWKQFWGIVYGASAEEPPEKEGLPKKMRQLTQDEVAFELMQRYPQPFANFRAEHWGIFFGIIFKK